MTSSQFWGMVAGICFVVAPLAVAHLHAPPKYKPLALLRALATWVDHRIQNISPDRLNPPPIPPSSGQRFPGMPDREQGEAPSTAKQKDFLRRLIRISESELGQLGKWQASWLIDSTLEGRKRDGAPPPAVGCSIGIIMGACFICWAAWRALP